VANCSRINAGYKYLYLNVSQSTGKLLLVLNTGLIRLHVLLTKVNSISCTNSLGERRASAVGLYSQHVMGDGDQVCYVEGRKFLPNPNSQLRSKVTSLKIWRRFLNVRSNKKKMARKYDSLNIFRYLKCIFNPIPLHFILFRNRKGKPSERVYSMSCPDAY